MKYEESSLGNKIFSDMQNHGYNWDSGWSELFLKGISEGIASTLGTIKGDKPKAVVVKNDSGTIVFGAYVEKNSSEEGYGYAINFFFNESDIPEEAEIMTVDDPTPYAIIADTLMKYNVAIKFINGKKMLGILSYIIVDAIKEYMRSNYDIDHVLELKNYFIIKAELDDGNRLHLTMTPEATLKQYIKDDESAQK